LASSCFDHGQEGFEPLQLQAPLVVEEAPPAAFAQLGGVSLASQAGGAT